MSKNRTVNHAFLIPLLMFLALLLDGIVMNLFSGQFISQSYVLTPRLLLLVLVLSTCFFPKQPIFLYALLFGVVYDSYYSGIIGLYAAGLATFIYLLKKVQNHLEITPGVMVLIYAASLIYLETFIYAMYRFIGMIDLAFGRFLLEKLGPTLLLNLIFLIVFYYPFYKLSQWMYK